MMIFVFFQVVASAQDSSELEKITAFLGVNSEEEISSEEYELLQDALRHPIRINLMSKSRLIASGLFTPYQAASLVDYRKRFGNVLSFAELASVDGFGQQCVELLKPFLSLDSGGQGDLTAPKMNKVYNELSLRGGYKYSTDEQDWQYGVKYGLDFGQVFQASLGLSKSNYSASISYDFRKIDAKVILGDFNARFGQGLLTWNGVLINSLTSPNNFMKKASGVTSVRSFTGSSANTGAAAEFGFGRFSLTTAYAISQMRMINFRRLGRLGSVGVTILNDGNWKSSLDAAACIRGVNLFGEAAYNWSDNSASVVMGTDFTMNEKARFASLLGWSHAKQSQFAFSSNFPLDPYSRHSFTLSSDFIYHLIPKDKKVKHSIQEKFQLNWQWKILDYLTLNLRLSDRFRTWGLRHRAELRIDVTTTIKNWSVDSRVHLLKSRNHSALSYINASYRLPNLTLHSRLGVFFVDNWDDRIYAYEYDVPGSFNVPAYYGRGVWIASMLSWKVSRLIRLYARASYISYPFMSDEKKKPGKAELKLQSVFKF